jgi:hypothetical protein
MSKLFYFLIFTSLFITSCNKDESELFFMDNVGMPSAFVLKAEPCQEASDSLKFILSVGVFKSLSEEVLWIPAHAFTINEDQEYYLSGGITSTEIKSSTPENGFCNLMLIDCSGDNSEIDPTNQTVRAMNEHLQKTATLINCQTGIAYYGISGSENAVEFEPYDDNNPLNNSQEYDITAFFAYTGFYRGDNPRLYDAIFIALDTLNAFAVSGNKSITVFTHSKDLLSTHNPESIIQKAKLFNVKINFISIGENYSLDYFKIASKTGGFFSLNTGSKVLSLMDRAVPVITSLDRILLNDLHYYSIKAFLFDTRGLPILPGIWFKWKAAVYYEESPNTPLINNELPFYIESQKK